MIVFTRLAISFLLVLVIGAIGHNGFNYFNYGGFSGGWFSTALVLGGHLFAIGAGVAGIIYTWKVGK